MLSRNGSCRLITVVVTGVIYAMALADASSAQSADDPAVLNAEVVRLYHAGRYNEATEIAKRVLAIREKALGPEHPDVGTSLNNLAGLYQDQGDWAQAAEYWRRSTNVIQRRARRGLGGAAEGSAKGEAQRSSWQFAGLLKMTHRLATQGRVELEAQARGMFETAQWAQASEAAASLAQMASRSAKGSPQLAEVVRERQDLVGEWQIKDKLLIAAKSQEPAKRKAAAELALADRLGAIDARLAAIDARLAKDFPDYAGLTSPAPVVHIGRAGTARQRRGPGVVSRHARVEG